MKLFTIILFFTVTASFAQKHTTEKKYFYYDYSDLYPNLYLVPKKPYNGGVLCLYYCAIKSKNWMPINPDVVDFFAFYNSYNDKPIYGAKGYRYAYSWFGYNAKPIELELLKEDNKWKVE